MCDVYRNALFIISADDAVDARGGCFKTRHDATAQPFKLRLRNLDSSWWVTVDERNLFEWVDKAPLSKRAWGFQERQLARRVLHFTENEVFWECQAPPPSFRSETYQVGAPLKRDFLQQAKLQLPASSVKHLEDDAHLKGAWDEACKGFSKRLLSRRSDKLPALSGLAKEFGKRFPADTYIAGQWSSTLPRTLLWTASKPSIHDRPPPSEYLAPSWSWMSMDCAIEISSMHSSHSVATILGIDSVSRSADRT